MKGLYRRGDPGVLQVMGLYRRGIQEYSRYRDCIEGGSKGTPVKWIV